MLSLSLSLRKTIWLLSAYDWQWLWMCNNKERIKYPKISFPKLKLKTENLIPGLPDFQQMLWATLELWIFKDRQTSFSDTEAGEKSATKARIRKAESSFSSTCWHFVCHWNTVIVTWNDLYEIHWHGSLLFYSWQGKMDIFSSYKNLNFSW